MTVRKVLKAILVCSLIVLIVIGVLVAAISGTGLALFYEFNQEWQDVSINPDYNTVIYDCNGKPIAVLHGPENREPAKSNTIPEHVKQAFLAVEDTRFFEHRGIDVKGIVRALWVDLQTGYLAQGGSTITQQLARNAFLNQEKTWQRKVKEAVLAFELERRYSKDAILTLYLNKIYFGHGVYGVESAARLYFNKSVSNLNKAEAALLAGIPKNPSQYSPYRHSEACKGRQGTVLDRMVAAGYIDEQQRQELWQQRIVISGFKQSGLYEYPYFVDYVISELVRRYPIDEEELYRGGYKVYTTVDPQFQQAIEQVFSLDKYFPTMKGETEPVQAAMVVLDHSNGRVLGMIGGREYQVRRGFNRATQLQRQPGSVIKPIVVYAPALEQGFEPDYLMDDSDITLKGWTPNNYGGYKYGNMSMEFALSHSVNIYAVKLLNKIGIKTGYRFGLNLELPLEPTDKVPALALGGLTHGVAPIHLVGAYGAFANSGTYFEPISVVNVLDRRGFALPVQTQKRWSVMKPENARKLTQMLTKVVTEGTGKRAKLERPVAGKTGTNQLPSTSKFEQVKGNKDVWFVGYTPEVVAAVWMGYDNTTEHQYLKDVYGGTLPTEIWRSVMELGLKNQPIKIFMIHTRSLLFGVNYARIWL